MNTLLVRQEASHMVQQQRQGVRSPASARHDGALMGACGAPDPPLTETTEIV